MKERQRWSAEEDSLVRAYVKKYGAKEWNLVSERMNTPLDRDAKSCLERWKNYLKPGIKKGPLSEDEKGLVINLQAKHGNKWKKIAAEVPGRTAKRLGKWWEVYKEKQDREQKENNKTVEPIDEAKYDQILETFAEKLVKERPSPAFILSLPIDGISHSETSPIPSVSVLPTTSLPPWLSNANRNPRHSLRPPFPSVTLSLSPSTIIATPTIPWLQPADRPDNMVVAPLALGNLPLHGSPLTHKENIMMPEMIECIKDLEECYRTLAAHKKEAAWRLRRVEQQLDSTKASRKRNKIQEIEAQVNALREEERASLERIEMECREQLASLMQEEEAKEQKLAEQWASKHSRLTKFLEQMGSHTKLPERGI